jgi:hypothetical protein
MSKKTSRLFGLSLALIAGAFVIVAFTGKYRILPPDLSIPQVAPDFTLLQADGRTFTLTEQLAHGPVVLVFLRGDSK